MNILILGGGGREHAFAYKLSSSPLCKNLYIAPGNAGTQDHGTNVPISVNDFDALKKFSIDQNIEIIVVGPEEPLVKGIVDNFQSDPDTKHIQLVGPSAKAAQLEGSKAYAKQFMAEYDIPTASYREFTISELQEGIQYIHSQKPPIVLKADGLAAGKGVIICNEKEDAIQEFKEMLNGRFGDASAKVVIEDFLSGIEFSVFVITDGLDYLTLPVAKDYKRIGEGDTGPNTGGMGAVSPVPFLDNELSRKVEDRIIIPTINGIKDRNLNYRGFVFFGLINVGGDPYVIEYNCRMGDPETEAVLPRITSDLLPILKSLDDGSLKEQNINFDPRTAVTVMLVSGGYPGKYEKSKLISEVNNTSNSIIFHAGTKLENNKLLTNGGRVLAITSLDVDKENALKKSMKNAEIIQFEGKNYRRDIGADL